MIIWTARALIIALAVGAIGYLLSPVWLTLAICVLLYLLLEPLTATLQALGARKDLAITASLLPPLLLLGFAGVYAIDTGRLYLPQLDGDLGRLQHGFTALLNDLGQHWPVLAGLTNQLAEQSRNWQPGNRWQLDQLLASTSLIASLVINVLLVPPLAWFMLRDYRSLRDRLLSLLPNSQFELGWLLYQRISVRLQAYLRGLFLQALILSSITAGGFWIIGLPSPLMLGVLTGVAGLIPYLGPFLALLAPVLLSLLGPGLDGQLLLEIILVLVIGFGFDNLVVIPFLLASSVNLHPAVAVLAVVIAGALGGIAAMVIVIPLLGMLRIVATTLYGGLGGNADPAGS